MRTDCAAEVEGPVPGERPPYGAPPADVLAATDYVCEEFLLGGEAAAYVHPGDAPLAADGMWTAEPAAVAPYRTRVLVVRPVDPAAFSGTVFLEWQNVSAGVEQPAPTEGEVYRGHAWVGVSAQVAGLYGTPRRRGRLPRRAPLLDADPQRYGGLLHPGEPACFDIFSAAARAVGRDRGTAVDPMGGLPVARVVATGGSQSAMRLCAYANAVHPRHRAVDAFVLSVWEGRAPRLDAGAADPLYRRTTVREDLDVPLLVVNSEFETTATAELALHDTPRRRVWEVTGTPHGVGRTFPPTPAGEWGPNPVSWRPVHEAALRAVHSWVADGVAPAEQPRVTLAGRPVARIVRGEGGNAWGGIRLPELAVPVAEHRGRKGGTGSPPVYGGRRAYPDALVSTLYRSRADYRQRWQGAVEELVSAGVVLPEDAPAMRDRGAEVAASLSLP